MTSQQSRANLFETYPSQGSPWIRCKVWQHQHRKPTKRGSLSHTSKHSWAQVLWQEWSSSLLETQHVQRWWTPCNRQPSLPNHRHMKRQSICQHLSQVHWHTQQWVAATMPPAMPSFWASLSCYLFAAVIFNKKDQSLNITTLKIRNGHTEQDDARSFTIFCFVKTFSS